MKRAYNSESWDKFKKLLQQLVGSITGLFSRVDKCETKQSESESKIKKLEDALDSANQSISALASLGIRQIQYVTANYTTAIAVGSSASTTIDISSYGFKKAPQAVPISAGYFTTTPASNISTTSLTANAINLSNGSHSGQMGYLLIERT